MAQSSQEIARLIVESLQGDGDKRIEMLFDEIPLDNQERAQLIDDFRKAIVRVVQARTGSGNTRIVERQRKRDE